jgi:hypothetical protein
MQTVEPTHTELEIAKIKLEIQKLAVERSKARWTGGSILASLVVAFVTMLAAYLNQREQSQSAFELKATELVLGAQSSDQARDTAKALQGMFPDRLPMTFARPFESGALPAFGPDIVAAKTELLRIIPGSSPERQIEVKTLWSQLFKEDLSFKVAVAK